MEALAERPEKTEVPAGSLIVVDPDLGEVKAEEFIVKPIPLQYLEADQEMQALKAAQRIANRDFKSKIADCQKRKEKLLAEQLSGQELLDFSGSEDNQTEPGENGQ